MYKGTRKVCTATFSKEGMKHLRTSGYAKNKGVKFIKVNSPKKKLKL